jgi:hypothetical protein
MIFAHALRESNMIVASNEPLQLDLGIHRARLEDIMATVDPSALAQSDSKGTMETCQSVESRTQDQALITDDNMGEEWRDRPWE